MFYIHIAHTTINTNKNKQQVLSNKSKRAEYDAMQRYSGGGAPGQAGSGYYRVEFDVNEGIRGSGRDRFGGISYTTFESGFSRADADRIFEQTFGNRSPFEMMEEMEEMMDQAFNNPQFMQNMKHMNSSFINNKNIDMKNLNNLRDKIKNPDIKNPDMKNFGQDRLTDETIDHFNKHMRDSLFSRLTQDIQKQMSSGINDANTQTDNGSKQKAPPTQTQSQSPSQYQSQSQSQSQSHGQNQREKIAEEMKKHRNVDQLLKQFQGQARNKNGDFGGSPLNFGGMGGFDSKQLDDFVTRTMEFQKKQFEHELENMPKPTTLFGKIQLMMKKAKARLFFHFRSKLTSRLIKRIQDREQAMKSKNK